MLHSFFFLHIFLMDLMFNKTERIAAFEAWAICASAKHCRRSSGLISAPCSTHSQKNWCCGSILFTVGWEGDLFAMWILFPTKFYTMHVRQIPSRTDAWNAKAWDEQNLTDVFQKGNSSPKYEISICGHYKERLFLHPQRPCLRTGLVEAHADAWLNHIWWRSSLHSESTYGH